MIREYDMAGEGADVTFNGERPEKKPLPTKEQVSAITDIVSLEAIDADLTATITKIETDLEFRDGDDDWHARARGALMAHRICQKHIVQRLRQLKRGDKKVVVEPQESKLERGRLHLERIQAAKDASVARKERERLVARRMTEEHRNAVQKRAAQAVYATALGNAFMHKAHGVLPPETFAEILRRATAAVEHAARGMLPEHKTEGPDEVEGQGRSAAEHAP